ncbi:MAG TPA: hypothetical protein DCX14_04565 [Flavobacteriales bacterium]|nr:hypothetical protein [Flavobacteriales bacterium]HAW19436.1 hypothetical protein [Flavobacteriales bacterium]
MKNWSRHITPILFLICLASTSCKDKEPVEEKPIVTEEQVRCENTCIFSTDGSCDDGGPDSKFGYCDFGTDCDDCGERNVITVKD